jgi:hypothetical protein
MKMAGVAGLQKLSLYNRLAKVSRKNRPLEMPTNPTERLTFTPAISRSFTGAGAIVSPLGSGLSPQIGMKEAAN